MSSIPTRQSAGRLTHQGVPALMRERPPLGPEGVFHLPRPVLLTLGKGAAGFLLERNDLPLVYLRLILRCGSACDPAELPGVAYVTSQMLDEGAGERTALALSSDLLQIGAGLSIWADGDTTSIALQVLRRHLPPALDILADLVLRPHFSVEEWDRVRQELISRALQRRSRPSHVAQLAFKAAIYGGHTYGRPMLPLPQHLQALECSHLRGFHRRRYGPENTLIAVAGAVGKEELEELWRARFSSWRRRVVPPGPGPARRFVDPRRFRRVPPRLVLVERRDASQSVLRVGHLGPSRLTEDYAGLRVLNTILGGSFTCRLNLNLREKHGFTYGVGSSFVLPREAGLFVVSTSVETDDTSAALREILREMRVLRDRAPASRELRKAKQLVLEDLPRQAETLEELAEIYGELAAFDLPFSRVRRLPEEVTALTPASITTLARRYLHPDGATIVVVGDAARLQVSLQKLFGRAQLRDADGQLVEVSSPGMP
jgi:zinc protease